MEIEEILKERSAISLYLSEIKGHDLLTAEEEKRYARLAQKLLVPTDAKDKYGNVIYVALPSHERREMVRCNQRLVFKIAKRIGAKHGVGHDHPDFLDLIEEGNIGLFRAIELFDHEEKYRFSTYATWWITQAVEKYFADQPRIIRLPVHAYKDVGLLRRAKQQFCLENHTEKEAPEPWLAENLSWSDEKVKEYKEYDQTLASYNEPIGGDEGGRTLEDIIFIEEEASVTGLTVDEIKSMVDRFLAMLTNQQREVVCMRFGLRGYEKLSLREVGERIHVTRERVRKIQLDAIKQLSESIYAKEAFSLLDYGTE